MPPMKYNSEDFDAYAEAEGLPIGESDSYLIAMVNSVEAEVSSKVLPVVRSDAPESAPLSRRALLLSGKY